MIEGVDFAVASTRGDRTSQQDDWGVHVGPPSVEGAARLLVGLADGMGGMPAGGLASEIAIRGFLDGYLAAKLVARDRLNSALLNANRKIAETVTARPELAGMGCTFIGALFFDHHLEWISVGDSYMLLYRSGKLRRINPLHTVANALADQVRRGTTSHAEAERHPDPGALTSVLQGKMLTEVSRDSIQLVAGDLVMLASDGITTLAGHNVGAICAHHGESDMATITTDIIGEIDDRRLPGQDNATVLAVRCPPRMGLEMNTATGRAL